MLEPNGKRRLAAIVVTNMVGYRRLMGLDELGTLAKQKAFQEEVFDPVVPECGRRVVNTIGDGALIEFDSTVNVLRWTTLLKRKITKRERDASDDLEIAYRIGINIGDILVDGQAIF